MARILAHHAFASPPTTAQCEAALHVACYSPAQFQQAYDLALLYNQGDNGSGETIVNPALYQMAAAHDAGIVDVTAGTNTVTFPQCGSVHTGSRLGRGHRLRPVQRCRHHRRRAVRAGTGGGRGRQPLIRA